jgi:hypothetical protein
MRFVQPGPSFHPPPGAGSAVFLFLGSAVARHPIFVVWDSSLFFLIFFVFFFFFFSSFFNPFLFFLLRCCFYFYWDFFFVERESTLLWRSTARIDRPRQVADGNCALGDTLLGRSASPVGGRGIWPTRWPWEHRAGLEVEKIGCVPSPARRSSRISLEARQHIGKLRS